MKTAASVPAYQHVQELRGRLSWCAMVLVAGGIAGYVFRSPIIGVLQHPLGQDLFYTSPTGSFEFVMRICMLVGFLFAVPTIIYHLLRFIEPALPGILSRRLIATVIAASFALMTAGVAFGYFVSLPTALHFFNHVGEGDLKALITADQYFTFVVSYLGIFAAVFQLPLLLLFINRIKPLGPGTLGKYRKYVIVASFVLALLTPTTPDPLSQAILALPVIALYEISIWLVWLTNVRRRQRAKSQVAVESVATVEAAAPSQPRLKPATRVARPALAPIQASPAPHRPVHAAARPFQPTRMPSPPRPATMPLATSLRAGVLDLSQATVIDPVPPPRPSGHIIDLRTSGAH